jgi:predicted phage-related endonuclease
LATLAKKQLVLGGKVSVQITNEVIDFDQETADWVQRYRETMAEIKALQEQADIARTRIESAMGDCQIGFYHNRPLVRWTTVTTTRLDTTKVKAALSAELIEQFSNTSVARRFTLLDEDSQ